MNILKSFNTPYSLVTSIPASECLNRLRWVQIQGGKRATKRFNVVRSKEIDIQNNAFQLIIEDVIFSRCRAEVTGQLKPRDDGTEIFLEFGSKSIPETLILLAAFFGISLLLITNKGYLGLVLLFMLFAMSVIISGAFFYRNMFIETIKLNLDAKELKDT
jgi:hypothetical protein